MQYRWDDFLIDFDAFRLERAGAPVPLEPKAFDLLALLVQRPGHLFSKQELFGAVWPDTAVTDHALTRVIAQLRRALGDEAREARYIETVPTRGYRWVRPTEEVAPGGADDTRKAPLAMPRAPGSPTFGIQPRVLGGAAALAILAVGAVGLLSWTARGTQTSAVEYPGSMAMRAPADPTGSVSWPVQLTSRSGLDLQPAFSPAGDALAFVSDRSGSLEIYVRALEDGGTEEPLTRDGGQNVQPAWSPDGRLIAYHSYRGGGIWVMPARGGVARQVVTSGSNPAWSPDGLRIAFNSDEHADVTPSAFGAQSGSTIRVVNVDGSGLRELTRAGEPIGGHALPVWSPDGRYLAFSLFDIGLDGGVWLVTTNSGKTKRLHSGKGIFELAFAPDGSALYGAGGEALVVRLPFDAATGSLRGPGEMIPMPGVPGARGLTISPDGRRLAFGGLASNSQIWAQPITRNGAKDGPARPLTTDTSRRTSMGSLSPDGSKVAYMSTRRGEPPNVWVMNLDGTNRIQVTSDESADGDPRWFPDGQRVAYRSNRGNAYGVWSVDIATRRETLMVGPTRGRAAGDEGLATGHPAELQLAPSMSQLAFSVVSPPEGRRVLYVSALEPFAPRAVTDQTRSVGYPAWSPDERRLAVEIKDGSSTHAGVIDLGTGELRQLTHDEGQTWVRSWSPDGRKIALAVERDGRWSLVALDVETGARTVMTPAAATNVYMRYPEWSPRGDLVLFERGELTGNIWMLALR